MIGIYHDSSARPVCKSVQIIFSKLDSDITWHTNDSMTGWSVSSHSAMPKTMSYWVTTVDAGPNVHSLRASKNTTFQRHSSDMNLKSWLVHKNLSNGVWNLGSILPYVNQTTSVLITVLVTKPPSKNFKNAKTRRHSQTSYSFFHCFLR